VDLLEATARCIAVLLELSPRDRSRVLSALRAVLDLTDEPTKVEEKR
jgi:hypothetical protein